jgi:hypothetical protein
MSGDHDLIVAELRRLAHSVQQSSDRAWSRQPAVRVIDCVLSLNRNYDGFVVPRLHRFEKAHPAIQSVSDLQRLMKDYSSPHRFVKSTLEYDHEARAIILSRVVDYLIGVRGGSDQRLTHWAAETKPTDYTTVGIPGFGLAGFQYLRMLFGANTTKPDMHICGMIAKWVGHRVAPIQALLLLEKAAVEAGVRLRDLDTTLWEASARCRVLPPRHCA